MGTYEGVSSFTVQPYRRKQLKNYFELYSKDNLNPLWDDNVGAVLKEQGFNITESPRSIYKVEKLFQALDKFEPDKAPRVNLRDQHVQQGLSLARACFERPKNQQPLELPAFTPDFVISVTSNPSGSPGLTAWGQTKAESYIRAFDRGCQIIKGVKRPEPCLAFKRTQFNDKTRLVWGYPYSMTAIEGLFFRPVIDHFKKNPGVMAFAMPDLMLGAKLRNSSYHKRWCYVTDVSSFDSSLSAAMIHQAFSSLATWFDLDQVEPTTGIKYSAIFEIVEHYFIHTPIVMPDGNVYKGKRHGVPSGSYGTQWVDSFNNVVEAGTASSYFHLNISKDDIEVLGDDMEFWSDRKIDYAELASYLSKTFQATLKPEKGGFYRYDEPIKFLGRWWTAGTAGLPEEEITMRMAQPESFRKYSKDPEVRRCEVEQLTLSYVSQYREASQIYEKLYMNKRTRFHHTVYDYVRDSHMAKRTAVRRQKIVTIDADFLSGLQRYKLKYINQGHDLGTPIELQYWL